MNKRLQIAYVGNFLPRHSTENDIRWTLTEMGHTVVPIQENAASWDFIGDIGRRSNLVLFTHTYGFEPQGDWQRGMAMIKTEGVPTAAFHLDLYRGLRREPMIGQHWFFRVDKFFGVDGDPRSEQLYRERGVNHVWIKPGVVKRDCYMADIDIRYKHDIVFVGSAQYHPEWQHRQQLLEFLKKNFGNRYAKYGNPERGLRGHELNQLYASSKVVVGDTLCLNYNHKRYWSDRPYETVGRGGMLIMPFVEGLDEDFKDKEHIVYWKFGEWSMLRDKIEYYLQDADNRERIRRAGHEHVKANCTYHNRMQFLLDNIGA